MSRDRQELALAFAEAVQAFMRHAFGEHFSDARAEYDFADPEQPRAIVHAQMRDGRVRQVPLRAADDHGNGIGIDIGEAGTLKADREGVLAYLWMAAEERLHSDTEGQAAAPWGWAAVMAPPISTVHLTRQPSVADVWREDDLATVVPLYAAPVDSTQPLDASITEYYRDRNRGGWADAQELARLHQEREDQRQEVADAWRAHSAIQHRLAETERQLHEQVRLADQRKSVIDTLKNLPRFCLTMRGEMVISPRGDWVSGKDLAGALSGGDGVEFPRDLRVGDWVITPEGHQAEIYRISADEGVQTSRGDFCATELRRAD